MATDKAGAAQNQNASVVVHVQALRKIMLG